MGFGSFLKATTGINIGGGDSGGGFSPGSVPDWLSGIDPETQKLYVNNQAFGSNDPNNANRVQVQGGLDAFKSQFQQYAGRAPTNEELSAYAKNALYGEWNAPGDLNYTSENALAGQYLQNTLGYTAQDLQGQQFKKYQSQASQHADTINSITQQLLGRAANPNEITHYGSLIASGSADPYQIQQFIQATPEYQNTQDTQFRQGLDTQLQQSNTDFFNRAKGGIAQQYAMMGRSTSPALDVALTDLAAKLNSERQSYLAQVGAQQYGSNKSAAVNDYESQRQGVSANLNNNTQSAYQNFLTNSSRANDLSNYYRQQADYNAYADKYMKTGPGTLDYLNTAFNGLNAAGSAYKAYATGGAGTA